MALHITYFTLHMSVNKMHICNVTFINVISEIFKSIVVVSFQMPTLHRASAFYRIKLFFFCHVRTSLMRNQTRVYMNHCPAFFITYLG
jgi:hypothetical protein